MTGQVILLVRFRLDGSVDTTEALSGNPIFKTAAIHFIQGWQANPYSGPRECPIVVTFQLNDSDTCDIPAEPTVPFERVDLQHVILRGKATVICDPGGIVLRRKRRFFIF